MKKRTKRERREWREAGGKKESFSIFKEAKRTPERAACLP